MSSTNSGMNSLANYLIVYILSDESLDNVHKLSIANGLAEPPIPAEGLKSEQAMKNNSPCPDASPVEIFKHGENLLIGRLSEFFSHA